MMLLLQDYLKIFVLDFEKKLNLDPIVNLGKYFKPFGLVLKGIKLNCLVLV
jgi:hypothetical protein